MKRVIIATSDNAGRKKFKDIIDIEKFNIASMRRYNVTITYVEGFLEMLDYFHLGPTDQLLRQAYAVELASRVSTRFGEKKLPNVKGNLYSGYRYYSILRPFSAVEGLDIEEDREEAAGQMLEYLMRTIKLSTVTKWLDEEYAEVYQ